MLNNFDKAEIKASTLKNCYEAIEERKRFYVCYKQEADENGELLTENPIPYDEHEEYKVQVYNKVMEMIEKML